MVWEVRSFGPDTKGLENALRKGWEPFAVTETRGIARVWVRRSRYGL